MSSTPTSLEALADIPLFDELNRTQLETLARYMSVRETAAGEQLFAEGDAGDYMGFVIDGELTMVKGDGDTAVVLARMGRGRSFGDMALVDNMPRSASARASKPTRLVILERRQFDQILDDHHALGVHLLRKVARLLSLNLRRTSAQLAEGKNAAA